MDDTGPTLTSQLYSVYTVASTLIYLRGNYAFFLDQLTQSFTMPKQGNRLEKHS